MLSLHKQKPPRPEVDEVGSVAGGESFLNETFDEPRMIGGHQVSGFHVWLEVEHCAVAFVEHHLNGRVLFGETLRTGQYGDTVPGARLNIFVPVCRSVNMRHLL